MSEEIRRRRRSIIELIDEYFDAVERAAREFIGGLISEKPSWDTEERCLEPLANIFVTANEVIITVDLPLVKPESIRVEPMGENVLEISAEMKKKLNFGDLGLTHRRGEFEKLRCRTRIPVPVEIKHLKISFRRGILEVKVPRKRRIPVG